MILVMQFGKGEIHLVIHRVVGRETITQHRTLKLSMLLPTTEPRIIQSNIDTKTLRTSNGGRKGSWYSGYFLPFATVFKTDSERWCLRRGEKRETFPCCFVRKIILNSVEFVVDVGRRVSFLFELFFRDRDFFLIIQGEFLIPSWNG